MEHQIFKKLIFAFLVITILITGCSQKKTNDSDSVKLTLAAYTTPREAYGEILPMFQSYWLEKTGQSVIFEESYLGSGAQSRAVVEGFEADIVALSLEADVTRIVNAGLITHDWKSISNKGIVSTSIVSFAVRQGNPLDIQDWEDLITPGVEILTPNPRTSGGAQWNLLALYGALLRGQVPGVPENDPEAAQEFVIQFLRNVTVMDKGARESITNFEQGIGSVAITYENEVMVGQQKGQTYELVIPSSTILIENPVAMVDVYAEKHGTLEVAQAFVEFLFTPEIQEVFSRYGLRSVDPGIAQDTADQYAPVPDLFSIEQFGGWDIATPEYFGDEGIFTKALLEVQGSNP